MTPPRTYTIIKTFIDKKGHLQTGHTGIRGGGEKEALHVFNGTVRAAGTTHPRVTAVVLIDAFENVIAEWTKPVELGVAA